MAEPRPLAGAVPGRAGPDPLASDDRNREQRAAESRLRHARRHLPRWRPIIVTSVGVALAIVSAGIASGPRAASAGAVPGGALPPSLYAATTAGPDFAVYLDSWRLATVGSANVEAVWRVENRGPATDADGQGVASVNTPGLTWVDPTPDPPSTFRGFSIPPLAAGATFLITTRVHADDTSSFVLQMHVQVPGAPYVMDANSADNDALLVVRPAPPPPPPPPVAPQPPPGSPVTVTALKPQTSLAAKPGTCRASAPDFSAIFSYTGLPQGFRLTVTYPRGTVVNQWPADTGFPPGTTRVVFGAWGLGLDPSTAVEGTSEIIVSDTERPKVVPPRSAVLATTARSARGAKVAFKTLRATDNCPGVRVVAKPPSGSTFRVGTTTVTFTATDASGNTATAKLRVKVRSRVAP